MRYFLVLSCGNDTEKCQMELDEIKVIHTTEARQLEHVVCYGVTHNVEEISEERAALLYLSDSSGRVLFNVSSWRNHHE